MQRTGGRRGDDLPVRPGSPAQAGRQRSSPWLFFANRGLEPIYAPERVIKAFAAVAVQQPEARLVVANDGSLRAALEQQVRDLGLAAKVEFVGRLDAKTQGGFYARAGWYLSLPQSDSVAVSVLEAMAHECLPILSDLPANHELVGEGAGRGLILRDDARLPRTTRHLCRSSRGRHRQPRLGGRARPVRAGRRTLS